MKFFSRLLTLSVSGILLGDLLLGPAAFSIPLQHSPSVIPSATNHASQGYLGIVCSDVTTADAAGLGLKEVKGTEIINVDRDGPAAKAGLHPHDVILEMDGQNITGEQQLRRMLHETPAGRTVSLLISRAGQQKSIQVQLADRETVEKNAWTQHVIIPAHDDQGEAFWGESSLRTIGNGFFSVFSSSTPSVGLELDMLGSQLADFFGVRNGQGLLVKRVAEGSWGARAGLQAGDVITKANGHKMTSLNDWAKMLHANRGKMVQITLIRNRKEQTTMLQAGDKKNHSELIVPPGLQTIGSAIQGSAIQGSAIQGGITAPNEPSSMFNRLASPLASPVDQLEAQLEQEQARAEFMMQQMEAGFESIPIPQIGSQAAD